MSYSTDGGLTWSAPAMTADRAKGLGGQPVVQPNGTVIVPSANANEGKIIAFRSTDGGVTWGKSVVIARAVDHNVAGNLRSGPLPSAEIDAAGEVYVVWQSCRFRKACRANDIVMSTSTDGLTWGAVTRIPIDPVDSGIDHFIPGIGVDPATSGATARLGLTYYFYSDAGCGKSTTCELEVGYLQSNDGGGSWTSAVQLVAPFRVDWNPLTSQGYMVGDYISTSWVGGRAFGAFAVALAPSGSVLDQAIYVPTSGLFASAATIAADRPTVVASSDHLRLGPVRTR